MNKLATHAKQIDVGEGVDPHSSFELAPFSSCEFAPEAVARPMVDLFQAVELAAYTVERSFVIQFLAPHRVAGTTTVASGFARAAAASLRRPVLYVDATPAGVAVLGEGQETLLSAHRKGLWLSTVTRPWENSPWLSWACLIQPLRPTLPIPLEEVETVLRLAQDAFGLVVVDSASLEELPQSAALARVCDGTVMVLDMRKSRRRQAAGACEAVRRLGGQVIGATVNRYRPVLPRWLDSLS